MSEDDLRRPYAGGHDVLASFRLFTRDGYEMVTKCRCDAKEASLAPHVCLFKPQFGPVPSHALRT